MSLLINLKKMSLLTNKKCNQTKRRIRGEIQFVQTFSFPHVHKSHSHTSQIIYDPHKPDHMIGVNKKNIKNSENLSMTIDEFWFDSAYFLNFNFFYYLKY